MTSRPIDAGPTRPTVTDTACVALAAPPPRLTATSHRTVEGAARLWCRTLTLPTVREIARATGLRSFSTVIFPFGRLIDVHATAIRLEWDLLERGWIRSDERSRPDWLADHARSLAARDPACLRLPGLVCSAIASADPSVLPHPALLAPLHALAAPAHPDADDITPLLATWPPRPTSQPRAVTTG